MVSKVVCVISDKLRRRNITMVSKKRIASFLCVMVACIFLIHKYKYEEWRYYYKYKHLPLDLDNNNVKLILLWTSYQGRWIWWSDDVGEDQFVKNCTAVMNGECMITSDKKYINNADIVLFSLQDLKQVNITFTIRTEFWMM